MVEVFKTDVSDEDVAGHLLEQIHSTFEHHSANFDLQDCDRILRIECHNGTSLRIDELISLLSEQGHYIEVLPD
jgi:hypothetical protein